MGGRQGLLAAVVIAGWEEVIEGVFGGVFEFFGFVFEFFGCVVDGAFDLASDVFDLADAHVLE